MTREINADARLTDATDAPRARSADPFRGVYKVRGLLMAPPAAFLLLCFRWETEQHALVFGLGAVIYALGLGGGSGGDAPALRLRIHKTLTRTGPYRYVRNPLYIGNTLILLGCCFFAELPWFAPIMLVYAMTVYHFVVRFEEAHLRARYGGEYERFLAEVPRWLPRLRPVAGVEPADASEHLWPSLVAEAHNMVLWVPFLAKELF